MKKYEALINVLDQLRREAPTELVRYRPIESDQEKVDQARSKAFIHLFIKVRFGLLDFKERENYLCDGSNDGGVDAYYIDRDTKKVYFIQSKFRTNATNFDSKNIDTNEILRMDVDRITKGQTSNERGNQYNGKVQGLIRAIQNIEDTARWEFIIVLLANIDPVSSIHLKRLVGEFPVQVFDHQRCYNELLFPVISGTYYNSAELFIDIDLTKKEIAQSRIHYPVDTEYAECEITLLFVPTIEIARVLHKYKNSILLFNPRSYLSLSTNKVNQDIAATVKGKTTNEFALFNNGITMLSDETRFSERTGRPYRGQLHVKNPQIINGGQTAYTLSHVYEESLKLSGEPTIFKDKEVMLKVITLVDTEVDNAKRLSLIEAVSKATNQQTSVVEADRRSNDIVQMELQRNFFAEFGYFYERKKGEFFDGLNNKYINKDRIIERELLLRLAFAISGSPEIARRSSTTVLFSKDSFNSILTNSHMYKELFFAFRCYRRLEEIERLYRGDKNNKFGVVHFGNALRYGKYAVVNVVHSKLSKAIKPLTVDSLSRKYVEGVLSGWLLFEDHARRQPTNKEYFRKFTDPETGEESVEANFDSYYKVQNVKKDIDTFFPSVNIQI